MSAAPSGASPLNAPAILPPGRALLGWWRELAPLQPHRLWFAHLALHRVEALVELARPQPLDAFDLAILRALSLPSPAGASPLASLHLERGLLASMLRALAGRGLVRLEGPGLAELTDDGRQALAAGGAVLRHNERRTFHFADGAPPCYLPLLRPGAPLVPPEGWHFDVALLQGCLEQGEAWKRRRHFPREVARVVGVAPGPADWREVIVDRAEQMLLALVETSGGLLGFAVQPETWVLQREAPVLALTEGWAEVLHDVVREPTPEDWRQAWQEWGQQHSVPGLDSAEVELRGHRLVVRAPGPLLAHLRAARAEAIKGEAWLLAGGGRGRAAAAVEVVEP